jgi:hypothetical protein
LISSSLWHASRSSQGMSCRDKEKRACSAFAFTGVAGQS